MLCILLGLSFAATAQDNKAKGLQKEFNDKNSTAFKTDTAAKKWKKGGLFSLTLSQTSLKNWAAGGDNYALSLNTALSGFAMYKNGRNEWNTSAGFNLGYVNTSSLGARKNDDRFDLLSKYGYALNPKLNIGAVFNFRTQFFKGYTYPDATTKVLSSDILAPAYILLGLGLDYKPAKDLSIFFSPVTARWVIVNDDSLSAKGAYGVTPGKKSLFQLGAFISTNYKASINKNVTYTGRLDLFSDYLDKPLNVAMNMTNLFAVKISNILSVTYSLDLIYDDNVRLFGVNHDAPALQVKSIIGAGLLVNL